MGFDSIENLMGATDQVAVKSLVSLEEEEK